MALAQAEAPKPEKLRSSMPFTVQSSVLQVKIFTGRDIGEQKTIKVGQATIKISDELKEGLVVYAGHGICEMDVRPAPILKLLIELTGRQTGEELIWAAALAFLPRTAKSANSTGHWWDYTAPAKESCLALRHTLANLQRSRPRNKKSSI